MKSIVFDGRICRAVRGCPDIWAPESGAFIVSTRFHPLNNPKKNPRTLAIHVDTRGYLVCTYHPGKKAGPLSVHRAVLLAWHGPARGREGCHMNAVKTDNRRENLKWGTRQDNVDDFMRHTGCFGLNNAAAKLSERDVVRLRELGRTKTFRFLCQRFPNVSRSAISCALRGKSWPHLPGAIPKALHDRSSAMHQWHLRRRSPQNSLLLA